ncbi:MAG: hypothetical protein V7785_09790 [Bermanella sp.]
MSQKKFLESVDKVIVGLNQEREETQVMAKTFFRVLTHRLPKGRKPEDEEIQAAIEQLKDVHRMAGLLIFATLPGSVITLPAIYAVGRRYGIEFLPSAFQKKGDQEGLKSEGEDKK